MPVLARLVVGAIVQYRYLLTCDKSTVCTPKKLLLSWNETKWLSLSVLMKEEGLFNMNSSIKANQLTANCKRIYGNNKNEMGISTNDCRPCSLLSNVHTRRAVANGAKVTNDHSRREIFSLKKVVSYPQ